MSVFDDNSGGHLAWEVKLFRVSLVDRKGHWRKTIDFAAMLKLAIFPNLNICAVFLPHHCGFSAFVFFSSLNSSSGEVSDWFVV